MERIPLQGDIWNIDFNLVRGHEQGGIRPGLVLSRTDFNKIGLDLVVVVAIGTKSFIPEFQVRIDPPAGGVTEPSFIFAHQIRTVSTDRLVRWRGQVPEEVLRAVLNIVVPMVMIPKLF